MALPDNMTVSRLGIIGGTFDPIHYGHLAIAEEARRRYALDAVLFMPAGRPPHKLHEQAEAEHRYAMTLLATADNPYFFVSRLELDRKGPSYTVETLHELHVQYPQAALHFIIGADMALTFAAWRDPQGILAQAHVIAAHRAGYAPERLEALTKHPLTAAISIMPAPGVDVSSTDLRDRARRGEELRYLVPDAVVAYLAKHRLYREGLG